MSTHFEISQLVLSRFQKNANWSALSQSKSVSIPLIVQADKPWDWSAVVNNPNVSLSFIFQHPQFHWNWLTISQHPSVTWEIVVTNPNKPWNWSGLSSNPSIGWEVVCNHPEKPWSWFRLSQNPNITFDIVLSNPNNSWNWQALSRNPNLSWDVIMANLDKNWDWCAILERINTIPGNATPFLDQIFSRTTHVDFNMSTEEVFSVLSSCKHVRLQFIFATYNIYPWDWNQVISHPNFNWRHVLGKRYIHWNWNLISQHPSVSWTDVIHHPKLPWNWKGLTANASVDWNIIQQHSNLPWCWKELASNHSIDIGIMLLDSTHAFDYIMWDWNKLSFHPKLTWQIVAKHIHKPWNWTKLSERFDELVQGEVRRHNRAALRIQRWWLDLYYNPARTVCIERIRRVCDEMNAALLYRCQ